MRSFANSADSGSIHSKLERSFSKLKLILSYFRSLMSQERLCDMTLLSIEENKTKKTNFDKIIDEFASRKARKYCCKTLSERPNFLLLLFSVFIKLLLT